MNLAASWEPEEVEKAALPDQNSESSTSRNSISTLRELALRLLSEVQCINDVSPLTIENGFDFYEEVSRFEIELIKRALLQTGGHQVRAARLLNLKVTTLNSKIKHYKINLSGFNNVYRLVDPTQGQAFPGSV
ncbi:MAG TPA: helix-turn-helix domain-containing protein [Pyrinomonadaceae bacterium]|jgi:transcriptional regulator with GAF, ATPase, and Fis domain|nr:helix-turn-helix domain-containing protein [Pyrinomonadaceae bacterium]